MKCEKEPDYTESPWSHGTAPIALELLIIWISRSFGIAQKTLDFPDRWSYGIAMITLELLIIWNRDVRPRGLASASRPKNLASASASWVVASASASWVMASASWVLASSLEASRGLQPKRNRMYVIGCKSITNSQKSAVANCKLVLTLAS